MGDLDGLSFNDVADLIEVKQDNTKIIEEAIDKAIVTALDAIGAQAESHAKDYLEAHHAVDTGRLKNSVTHQLDGDKSVYIGTNVEYAIYIETGTSTSSKVGARPFLRSTATDYTDEYRNILKKCLGG